VAYCYLFSVAALSLKPKFNLAYHVTHVTTRYLAHAFLHRKKSCLSWCTCRATRAALIDVIGRQTAVQMFYHKRLIW